MLRWLRSRADRAAATLAAAPAAPPATAPPPPLDLNGLLDAERFDEAEALAQSRTEADAADATAWLALARIASQRGRMTEAAGALARALQAAPGDAAVHARASALHVAAGRKKEAALALRQALALDAACPEALLQSGLAALRAGRADEAQRQWLAAAGGRPPSAEASFHLGNLHRSQGRMVEAERAYRDAIAVRAAYADAQNNLGSLLKDAGRAAEAAAVLSEAVRLRPRFASARFNLGVLLLESRRFADAAEHLREAAAADPKDADTQYWLGNASMGAGDAVAARAAYQAALRLDASYLKARWGAVMTQVAPVVDTQDAAQAGVEAFDREWAKLEGALRAQRPKDAWMAVGAQQPFYLAYVEGNHRERLQRYGKQCTTLMSQWATKVGVPAPRAAADGACRVGIVSSHIHNHSVWNAIVRGWVEHLDATRFELHLFHTGAIDDDQTAWAKGRAAAFHRGARDWTAWARAISDAQLDVLIYPEIGMDSTALRLASVRLARVQFAAWGHPITTGLPTLDGYLSAQAFEPEGAAAHYSETLHALPGVGCCYRPFGTRATAVDLAALGIASGDRVLVCPGTPFKYAPRFDALWAAVAARCRPCRLVFFRTEPRALSERFEQRLAAAFAQAGVDFGSSVRFVPWMAQDQFFGLLSRSQAMLDSPGFSGFNTTMQAIECGCPIVAWEGNAMRSRFASGILTELGLDEWVAREPAAFAERAARLCDDAGAARQTRALIATQRQRLFNDRASVAALGDVLWRAAGR